MSNPTRALRGFLTSLHPQRRLDRRDLWGRVLPPAVFDTHTQARSDKQPSILCVPTQKISVTASMCVSVCNWAFQTSHGTSLTLDAPKLLRALQLP